MARSSQGFSGNRHTFVGPDELSAASRLLTPFSQAPTGEVLQSIHWSAPIVSQFLSEKVLSVFRNHPLWKVAQPILLGSWGRGELTPKSDLDLLFCGDPEKVFALVTDLQNQGFRIRYRIPENSNDWSQGVLSADILALWRAQAETPEAQEQLKLQQELLFRNRKIKAQILKDLLRERKERARRFDSIQSFLEPQIKYGPGGLRDLFQGEVILDLFPEKFIDHTGHENEIFEYYRQYFLTLRQKLHFNGYSDVLVATEQFELAKWFGYSENSEFMRQIQRGLARVHFYSEWVLARAQCSPKKLKMLETKKLQKPLDLFALLKKDPSILAQYQVRAAIDRFDYSKKTQGLILEKMFSKEASDFTLQAVFNSRLIDKICPRILHLVGLVQHDQYHRFTADAHLLQACREVKRLQKSAQILGPLKKWQKQLSAKDWKILSWVALYHDLAKGLKGDHSEIGEKWVFEDLKAYGMPKEFAQEVAWLVRHHLELSIAAFRKNPQSPATWQALQDLGLNEQRLLRLALWTAIDIRATNPEAWTDWKAKLLDGLVAKLLAGGTQNFLKLKQKLPKGIASEVIDALAPELFENFSSEKLSLDLQNGLQGESSWVLIRDSQRKLWVRYHQKQDRPGLLSELVERIYSAGASVQHALVHTLPSVGVYDWFQVHTTKDPQALLKLLQKLQSSELRAPQVQFMSIDLISQTDSVWVVSFRGADQKGLLLAASLKLKELGAEIKSARVHTWGRQIEDLFEINPQTPQFLEALRKDLVTSEDIFGNREET
jgi:[protein-PII] uridylyltransferase